MSIVSAVAFAVIALLIWFVFLRPAEAKVGSGLITAKNFRQAGTYTQYPVGDNRSFRTPNQIPIAEAYVFQIKLDDASNEVSYSLNTLAAKEFEPGQRVHVEYLKRGIPPFWSRIYITDMKAVK